MAGPGNSPRVLYIGTGHGLFRATSTRGGFRVERLGLAESTGGPRSPVVIDIDEPARLYVGTVRGGALRSLDRGETWHEVNSGLTYKEVWWLEQHPVTGALYAGTGPASVFKSNDGGDTWTDCQQLRTLPSTKAWTFPMPPHIAHVKHLHLRADDPDLVFGAVEEGWLLRSSDGGRTWTNLTEGCESDAHTVYTSPADPSVVLSTSGTGVYRSGDGGDSFVASSDGMDRRYTMQLVFKRSDPRVIWTAAAERPPPYWHRPDRPVGANTAFYRSEDGARTWQRLSGGLPEVITAGPRSVVGDPQHDEAVFVGLSDGTVWATDDGGESFAQIVDLRPFAADSDEPRRSGVMSIQVGAYAEEGR